ncbi:MAG TPA: S9 family peptidase [Acidimicrobiales bacterium]|nr:S9 family peptidase [Acidimicrobiales bacterium]
MAGMVPKDLDRLVTAGDPSLAPDGRQVAFTITRVDLDANCYRRQVWLAPVDGSAPPRSFTSGEGSHSNARWSPDGGALAFVWHRDDDDLKGEEEQVFELRIAPVAAPGDVRTVASWPEAIEQLAWSPDASLVAFVARLRDEAHYRPPKARDRPPRRIDRLFYRLDSEGFVSDRVKQLFVTAADGSSGPQPVTEGPYHVEGLSWSPDGTRLAFTSGRHDSWDLDLATDVFAAGLPDPERGPRAPQRLTETGRANFSPSWSPDGRRIAYLSSGFPFEEPRHAQVAVLDVDSGEVEVLTNTLDRQCGPFPTLREPQWGNDAIWFRVEDAGNTHLYRSAPLGPVVGGDREVGAFDVAAGTVAFCASSPTATSELFVLDLASREERQLTDVGRAFTDAVELVAPVAFSATTPDGTVVGAWVMPPVGAEPGRSYPTLLNVHGGPFTQYGNRFFDEFELQAGAGFAVLYANPRGSSGSTEASARAIRWPEADDPGSGWGGVDYDDLMAVVDTAVARFDFIDGERLGVLGGSYGGYMASWMVGHTDRFRAALSERAANNLLMLEQLSDMATGFRTYVGVSHLDNPDAYLRQSPISYVRAITTPLLIVHSEDDLRCPVGQAEELFVALRLLGRKPEMVLFPGESHELSRSGSPRHRVMRAEIILDWFRRHLMDG